MQPSGDVSRSALRVIRLVLLSLSLVGGLAAPATSHGAPQRELVVGSEVDYPPFALGEAGGTPDGFTVDLWKAVAKEMGLKYRFRVQPFDEILGDFRSGRIDVLINLAYSDERERFASFSAPHVVSYGTIFTRNGSLRFDSEEELKGKSIIVLSGDLLHDYAVAAGYLNLVLVKDVAAGMKLLNEGKHDAMLVSRLAGLQTLKQLGINSVGPTGAPIRGVVQRFGFAVRHGDGDLLAQINEGMAIVRMNGTYQNIYEKWFGAIDPRPVTLIELAKILSPAALLIFLTGLAYFYQRRMSATLAARVAERTSELTATLHSLSESEQKLLTILDNVDAYIYLKDSKGCYLFANKLVRDLWQAKMEDVVGYPDEKFFDAATAANIRRNDRRVLEGGETYRAEESNTVKATGKSAVYQSTKLPLRHEDGSIYALCGISMDVTERKQAELLLRKLSLAVEQSPSSIAIADIDAKLEYVNDAFVRITGYSREELLGSNPRILHSGKTPRESYEALWQNLTQGRPWQGEFHNRRKDGSEYVEYATIAPLRQADGAVSHYVAVKEDITEKKRLGLELDAHRHHLEQLVFDRTAQLAQARDAAEAANRAKSIFLATMSHELRTPMNGIMGMTDLALRRATDPQQIDWLNKSKGSARHLLAIINDVLDLSRMEAEQLTLDEKDLSLAQVIEGALRTQDEAARAKGLILSATIDPSLPDLLRGDALRLGQILTNFISNAVKFSERGQITVHASVAEEDNHSVLLRIEVRDQGIGINPEDQARLFQAFTQADGSSTRKHGGTGLGLIIAKRLAMLMGGEVGADSTPGVGSTFWFTALMQRGNDIAAAPAVEHDVTGNGAATTLAAGSDNKCAADPVRALAVLDKLEPLLAAADTRASDLFKANRPLLLATLGAAAMQLDRQVASFDYPAALATVRELIRQAPKT